MAASSQAPTETGTPKFEEAGNATSEVIGGSGSPLPPHPQKYTLENLTAPIVTLLVGPDRTTFVAHKNILMKAEFFAKCLGDERFEEGIKNHVNLLNEDPQNMVAIIRFLYTGNLLSDNDVETINSLKGWDGKIEGDGATLMTLISLFIVAEKYCIEAMCDTVLKLTSKVAGLSRVNWCHLDQTKAAGFHGSKL